MPTAKLSSTSHVELNKIRDAHWDLDQKIGEILSIVALDVKAKILSRLPSLINEIESEMKQSEQEV